MAPLAPNRAFHFRGPHIDESLKSLLHTSFYFVFIPSPTTMALESLITKADVHGHMGGFSAYSGYCIISHQSLSDIYHMYHID